MKNPVYARKRLEARPSPGLPEEPCLVHLLPNATCTDGPVWLPASEWICTYVFGQVYLNLCTEAPARVTLTRCSVVCALELWRRGAKELPIAITDAIGHFFFNV